MTSLTPHGTASVTDNERWVGAAFAAIPLAALVWIVIFAWQPANFWILMTAGVGCLGILAILIRGPFPVREGMRGADLALGFASAVLLYAIFAVGRTVAGWVLPFAGGQVSAVYAIRTQAPVWAIAVALVLVIGPGEEVFWRGLVQGALIRRLGAGWGWAAATLIYGLVHVAAGNAMLVLAALVAGAFWGAMYLWAGRIAPVVVSHVLWDVTVFLLLPFR
ncbi:MAG TPA: type II CAAX endopeptidase family protein [Planctomycetota bacterium]|nr:type II CAAX endopeptidase family protein [Planctomycetota bacterium]